MVGTKNIFYQKKKKTFKYFYFHGFYAKIEKCEIVLAYHKTYNFKIFQDFPGF